MLVPTTPSLARQPGCNKMHPRRWIEPETAALLDVGCNVGAFLADCHRCFPGMHLAGVEVNAAALAKARCLLPHADLHEGAADALPFADAAFDCVSCIEVLEHIPAERRRASLVEMRRVLRPGGRLVLRTPHAGLFAWLDSNNIRFRFPGLYRRLLGRGRRDAGYADGSAGVVWHHHFSRAELLELAGPGWQMETVCYGGLFLFPLTDWLSWPFYRAGWLNHPLLRALDRVAAFDYGCDFGTASYGILLTLRRT
jgi:SAM-dependent methyltransferase